MNYQIIIILLVILIVIYHMKTSEGFAIQSKIPNCIDSQSYFDGVNCINKLEKEVGKIKTEFDPRFERDNPCPKKNEYVCKNNKLQCCTDDYIKKPPVCSEDYVLSKHMDKGLPSDQHKISCCPRSHPILSQNSRSKTFECEIDPRSPRPSGGGVELEQNLGPRPRPKI